MIFLTDFSLVSEDMEWDVLRYKTHALYDSFYPFQIFPHDKKLEKIVFADITIFCGSNGSGKSTVLNIIAEKLRLNRETPYNKTDFFDPYIERCRYNMYSNNREKLYNLMKISRIINSKILSNISVNPAMLTSGHIPTAKQGSDILQMPFSPADFIFWTNPKTHSRLKCRLNLCIFCMEWQVVTSVSLLYLHIVRFCYRCPEQRFSIWIQNL